MFLQQEDIDLIAQAVSMLKVDEPWVADLGAGSGTTAAAVFESNPKAKIWTIDISKENLDWAGAIVDSMDMRDRWVALCMDSVAAAEFLGESQWDLVLIDTSHEYEHTKSELEAWRPKLSPGGLIWLHDYVGYEGVTQAVDECVDIGTFSKVAAGGLGIILKPVVKRGKREGRTTAAG